MAKAKAKQVQDDIEELCQFFQKHWAALRAHAAEMHRQKKRGVFVADLSLGLNSEPFQPRKLSYVDGESAQGAMFEHLEGYDIEREIVFFFSHPLEKRMTFMRVLKEYPDGTPRPTREAAHKRWCGFKRTCPRCHESFLGFADTMRCTGCNLLFSASDVEHASVAGAEVPPISEYPLPTTNVQTMEDLSEAIRGVVTKSGLAALPERRRLIWLAIEFDDSVRTETLEGYFFNVMDERPTEFLRLLEQYQLAPIEGFFRRVCNQFPDSVPPRKLDAELLKADPTLLETLEDLSSTYYDKIYPTRESLWADLWQFWQTSID